jgi:hypothetical protein
LLNGAKLIVDDKSTNVEVVSVKEAGIAIPLAAIEELFAFVFVGMAFSRNGSCHLYGDDM